MGRAWSNQGAALSFSAAVLFDVMPKSVVPCLTLIFSGFLKEV
jgi:hypothetical protein